MFPKFYVKTHDDFRSTSVRSGTEFTDRIERLENLFSIDVGTDELNKWGVEGGYDLYWIGYEEAAFEEFDHVEHTVGGAIFYDLFTKSKVFVDYRHVFIEYDESPLRDGDADEIFGGIKGELLPKLVGLVKAGYEDRRYEDPTQDFSSVTVGASLGYNLSAHTTFTLAGERRNRESVYSINNFYTSNFVSLTLNQKLFFERLDGRLRFSYQNNDYPIATTEGAITQERDDDFYGVDAGVDYAIRDWLTTGVDYYYIERESNFDIFDFTDNRVLWRTSILL
jgi:hypothetical protein